MDEREAIRELYRKYWQCMIAKDADGLRRLMDEDPSFHVRFDTESGQRVLSGMGELHLEIIVDRLLKEFKVQAGTFNYYAAEHDSIGVTVHGDTAEMIGKTRVLAAVYGGRKSSWRLRGDFTLRKENGAWRFTSSKTSVY